MISESFIDKCLKISVRTPNNYKNVSELFSALDSIFKWCDKQYIDEPPLKFKNKYELVKYLINYRNYNGNNFDINKAIEDISLGKYSQFVTMLNLIENDLKESDIDEFLLEIVIPKKEICELINDDKKLKYLLEKIEYGTFEDNNSLISEWKNIIKNYHDQIIQNERIQSIQSAESLDLLNDDYSDVVNRYKQTSSLSDVLKTGFEYIDNTLPMKGFEKGRIYIIAGETGVGKSLFLSNVIANTLKLNKISKPNSERKTYIFITAENLIYENLLRLYCQITGEPHCDIVERIHNDLTFNLKEKISTLLEDSNSNVIFHYVPAMLTSVSEIETLLNIDMQKNKVSALFIDYLDLIKGSKQYDQSTRYEELSDITLAFKRIAVYNNIPVITVTQLNRSGYNNAIPSITSLSNSIQKANHSDFLAFLQNETTTDVFKFQNSMGKFVEGSKVKLTILKSRGGATNVSTTLFLRKKEDDLDVFNFTFENMPKINNEKYETQCDFSSNIF